MILPSHLIREPVMYANRRYGSIEMIATDTKAGTFEGGWTWKCHACNRKVPRPKPWPHAIRNAIGHAGSIRHLKHLKVLAERNRRSVTSS